MSQHTKKIRTRTRAMDRHQTQLQQQANDWLEKQALGLNQSQQDEFLTWLNTSPEHQAAYQQSQQIEELLTQFTDSDIEQFNMPPNKRPQPMWTLAACIAFLMISITSYQFWPQDTQQPPYKVQYQSSRGEQFDIELPDGSQISLDAQTTLALAFDTNKRFNNLTHGRVLFDVAQDPQRPFIITANESKITVLGTRFSVDNKPNRTRISVEHGRVKVQNKQQVIELVQGQQAIIDAQGLNIKNMDPHLIGAWRNGRLIFDNTKLSDVFAEFTRYHDTHFNFTNDSIKELKLSGTFSAEQLDNFLNLLPHVLPVKIESHKNQVVIMTR